MTAFMRPCWRCAASTPRADLVIGTVVSCDRSIVVWVAYQRTAVQEMGLAIRCTTEAWKVRSASKPAPLRRLVELLADATELAAEDDRERLQRRGLRTVHQITRLTLTLQPRALPLAQSNQRMCRSTTDRAVDTLTLGLGVMQSMPASTYVKSTCT